MKLRPAIKNSYPQIIAAYLAFLIMVGSSYYFASGIVKNRLIEYADAVMDSAVSELNRLLSSAEVSLKDLVFHIEDAVTNNASPDEVFMQLQHWGQMTMDTSNEYNNIFAYYQGHLLSIEQQENLNFQPSQSLWYTGAVEKKGKVNITPPYISETSGTKIMTASEAIYGSDDSLVAVVALDIKAENLVSYVENLSMVNSGYGFLVDEDFKFVIHKNNELLGQDARIESNLVPEHTAKLGQILAKKGYFTTESIKSYNNIKSMAFSRQLENNWFIGLVVPVKAYFSDARHMALGLSVLGLILASILASLLVMLSSAKIRSESASQLKSSFLANMSHEIRTPMNAIVGMAELIMREPDVSPSIVEYTAEIKNAGTNLLNIINDILDISRIEANRLDIAHIEYELPSVINDVTSISKMRLDSKYVDLIVDIQPDLPFKLIGDDIRLKQILLNILGNAIKFTEKGFVHLSVSSEKKEDDKIELKFIVADSGQGIKAENLSTLFKEFERFNSKKNRNVEGTGLGLAISKRIAQMMNGRVEVESEFGRGSTFTLYVLQSLAPNTPPIVELSSEKKNALTATYERSKLLLDSLNQAIESLGLKNDAYEKFDDFLNAIKDKKYDYIFLPYENKSFIQKDSLPKETAIVYCVGFSQIIRQPNVLILRRPITSMQIGNVILNRINSSPHTRSVSDAYVSFTSPEANILIVDDNHTNLKVASGLLSPYNMNIDVAINGFDAVEMVKRKHYDLVFMDHMMPGLDGVETTYEIRKLHGNYYQNLPIVALTANAVLGAREFFIEKKMNDFLAKPIDSKKLNRIIRDYIPRNKWVFTSSGGEAQALEKDKHDEYEGIVIEGLDVQQGLANCGNEARRYKEILEVFYQDGLAAIANIRLKKEYGDMKYFITLIHAQKSACAYIGASKESSLASKLEEAAKQGDKIYIDENLNHFLNSFDTLLHNIHSFLESNKKIENVLKEEGDYEALKSEAAALKRALELADSNSIDSILKGLDAYAWDVDNDEILEEIRKKVALFDFDKAREILTSLKYPQ